MSPQQARRLTIASIIAVALTYAVLAWHRRWMSDDGMIVLRTVRNLLDGNGPTFNSFERAEANTSTLWTYILALVHGVSRLRLEYLAVYLGLLLSIGAIVLGMDGTRRFLRARGTPGAIVPAGAFVMVGVFPFWDYATSGLESGLSFAWVALCWWMLVRGDRLKLSAFVFGLGPLVRPDLGIGSIVFFVALWLLHRPTWKRTLALGAIGMALPLAYEIFRMGYYGMLVPLPALAKSASSSAWWRGYKYLRDYWNPYILWIPLAAVIGFFVYAMRKKLVAKRDLIVIGAPCVTALLNAIYVMRVGGDFMHARMLLIPTFAALLPLFVLPVRRFTLPVIGVFAGWAIVNAIWRNDMNYHHAPIEDERIGYCTWTHSAHPVRVSVFINADRPASDLAKRAIANGERLFISQHGWSLPMNTAHDAPIVYAAGRLGTGGVVAPLDAIVADTLGLANPIGARITPTLPGYTGHEKLLPWAWQFADYGNPANDDDNLESTAGYVVRAARQAMQCGELAELLASVREPMSASRFWKNLTGSVRRTRLVIPSDPIEAQQKFCGNTNFPVISVSSEYALDGWSKYGVADGIKTSETGAAGHTSQGKPEQGPEWIALKFAKPKPISKVVLYPAIAGGAFPQDFEIQVWVAGRWQTRASRTDFVPQMGPNEFSWTPGDTSDRVRILVTKLRAPGESYVFELAEIETY